MDQLLVYSCTAVPLLLTGMLGYCIIKLVQLVVRTAFRKPAEANYRPETLRFDQRLTRVTTDWVTLDLGTVKLCHCPTTLDAVVGQRIDVVLTTEVARFAKWFGQPLPFPPTFFLFPLASTVYELTDGYGGCAHVDPGWIVLSLEYDRKSFRMGVRHELVHLHTYRYAGRRTPLLQEGFAGLIQWTKRDCPDEQFPSPAYWQPSALRPNPRWPALASILKPSDFFHRHRVNTSYQASASFTAYLVQRHGWEKYLVFYRRGRGWLFFHHFRRTFGLSFVRAEREWRAGRWAVQLPATD